MTVNKTLADYGYPAEGIVSVCWNGSPDAEDYPQEAFTPHTCGSCRLFNGECCTKEWNNGDESYYIPDRDDRDPDNDTCDDIDYEQDWLDELRDPVRCEYSSDKAYEQACKAIARMRRDSAIE